MESQPAPPKRRRRLRRWAARLFLASLFVGVVMVGALAWYASRVPIPPETPPIATTVIFASDGTRLASLDGGQDRTPVPLEQVPQVVRDAVLAAEDRKFYDHGGLDPFGIVRALWADLRRQGVRQGGSTITQQYVKNAYVGSDRSATRKAREAIIAVKLEQRLSKDEILERYLNAIYLGRGAYGVEAGSKAWFGRGVAELGPNEATYLAALIRSPETTAIDRKGNEERAQQRRESVIAGMLRSGTLDQEQAARVRATPIQTSVVLRQDRPATITNTDIGVEYVIDEVRRQLVARYTERVALGGGLRVTLTLDLERQKQAYNAVYGPVLPSLQPREPQGALVSIDEAGSVVALVGGRSHRDSQVNLALGKLGGGSGRQPGSTFKPFLLADVVESRYSVESAFPAPPKYVWKGGEGGADYEVENYEGQGFGGPMNLVDATRLSVNTVYAQVAQVVTPQALVERAKALGITSPLAPNASLVLGTPQVSPLEMASAYSTLARGGVQIPPRLIAKVVDADGRPLAPDQDPSGRRAVRKETADVVTEVLRQVVDRGTGTAARLDRPAAGKTGTTNDSTDAWFVGYTASPRLTTAVWVGWADDGGRPMNRVRGRAVSGGGIPAQIWQKYMRAATSGTPPGDFDEPPDLSEGNTLPRASGRDRSSSPLTAVDEVSPSTWSAPGTATTTAPTALPGSTTSTTRRRGVTTTTRVPASTTTSPGPSTTGSPPTTRKPP